MVAMFEINRGANVIFTEIHTPGATNNLIPTLLIELYFTYDPKAERDNIAKQLQSKLGTTVLKNVQGGPS